jgi:hypothetical protein
MKNAKGAKETVHPVPQRTPKDREEPHPTPQDKQENRQGAGSKRVLEVCKCVFAST